MYMCNMITALNTGPVSVENQFCQSQTFIESINLVLVV